MRFRASGFDVHLGWTFLVAVGGIAAYLGATRSAWALALLLFGPVSVVVHELGHAPMARRFGAWPIAIEVGAFEGRVIHHASGREGVLITAAGPVAHLGWALIGIAVGQLGAVAQVAPDLAQATSGLGRVNIGWVAGNLRPVGRSDGAQLLSALMDRYPLVIQHWAFFAAGGGLMFACGALLWGSIPVVAVLMGIAGLVVQIVAVERWWIRRNARGRR